LEQNESLWSGKRKGLGVSYSPGQSGEATFFSGRTSQPSSKNPFTRWDKEGKKKAWRENGVIVKTVEGEPSAISRGKRETEKEKKEGRVCLSQRRKKPTRKGGA